LSDSIAASGLLDAWDKRVHDPRPRVSTGIPALDSSLHRGGLAPGELAILGGRTHTRKTTVALNIMANLIRARVRVGFVALDETLPGYTAKLVSILTGLPMEDLEERWGETGERREEARKAMAGTFSVHRSPRPSFERLTAWLEDAAPLDMDGDEPPQVVFVDYLSLLERNKYAGQEVQRIQRLTEDLQVWTAEHEVVTVALHQVGRMHEGAQTRYHGDTPMTLESLKFGGEEVADIVFGTYRPALNPLGNMSFDEAKADLGEKFDEDAWNDAVTRVEQHKDITFLQLLKNRPGVRLNHRGVQLRSPSDSIAMVPVAGEEVGPDDRKVVSLRG
jgi:RecA/RadA recombinase